MSARLAGILLVVSLACQACSSGAAPAKNEDPQATARREREASDELKKLGWKIGRDDGGATISANANREIAEGRITPRQVDLLAELPQLRSVSMYGNEISQDSFK